MLSVVAPQDITVYPYVDPAWLTRIKQRVTQCHEDCLFEEVPPANDCTIGWYIMSKRPGMPYPYIENMPPNVRHALPDPGSLGHLPKPHLPPFGVQNVD